MGGEGVPWIGQAPCAINQSSCNKDFSCLKGFCPSFVTVEGGKLRKPQPLAPRRDDSAAPACPVLRALMAYSHRRRGRHRVVTIGQLLGMAAHIEGRAVRCWTWRAWPRRAAVYSHVVLAAAPDQLMNTRVAMGEADLVLAGDLVVATSADAMARLSPGRTRAVNSDTAPTAAFVKNPDWTLPRRWPRSWKACAARSTWIRWTRPRWRWRCWAMPSTPTR